MAVARLVGRAGELSALLARCVSEPAGAVLVTGEAGVGKTRLLDELAGRMRSGGALVLRGHGVRGGGPFRPLAHALVRVSPPELAEAPELRPYAAVLARLLPGWPSATPEAGHLVDPVVVLGEAVRALLHVLAGGRRAVLVLDDLHWADRDTLGVLEYLSADPPMPLVLAARDDERGPPGLDVVGRRSTRMSLDRLDATHVGVLAAQRAGAAVDGDVVTFLTAASGGLPFLVTELTGDLIDSGQLQRDHGRWRADGPLRTRVPDAYTRLVETRVAALGASERTLVRTAALLGDELDWQFVAAATGDDPSPGVRAAIDAGLFHTSEPDALHWRHALTRDAVLDGLNPPERVELSRRAAARLRGVELAGAQLAAAADLCARAGDRSRAAQLLLDLGREHLAAAALTAAGDALASAAALVDDGAGPAAQIAGERLRVLALAARTDDALALGEQVLPGLPVDGAAGVRLQLARACVVAERWDQAADHLDATSRGSAERLAIAAHVALGRRDVDGALRVAADAVAVGRRDGVPEAVCEALEITGRALRRSDPPASRAAFAEGERLAAEHGLVVWRIRALAEMGTHDMLASADLRRLRQARLLAEESGLLGTAMMLDLQLLAATAGIDGYVATLPFARRCAETAARLRLPGPAAHAMLFVGRGRFWSGDTEGALAALEEYLRTSPDPVPSTFARAPTQAYDAWLSHDGIRAAERLSMAVEALRASTVSSPAPFWGHWALLSTVVHPDDPAPLEELRDSDVLVQAANHAALHYGDAVLAARAGAPDRSRELVEAGDAILSGRNHERLFQRSLMITSDGAAAAFDAEVLLREALTRWEPAGEVRLVRWCRERLRMLGLPVPRPGRDHTAVPPALRAIGITGRELEVLRLVADGATNAEVATRLHLSPRTVETHVSNLLAKTGATTRGQLAGWLPAPGP
ncbi:AAA family ATPase [Actinomycetospora lutea]|uniref:ATP-binding protein n=1 Tax=Actinomycetospora lutea TaxID=663604 RepID=UPI0023657E35|nr:LuxR family transcriptional regulator [Actinomycetospora lutea]MDD7939048.1 AAA family ATPase [Actinomycetospora lutea]